MKEISTIALVLFCFTLSISQSITTSLDIVDPELTWPWNWDIISDGERLISVNENGFLNIKEGSIWQNYKVDSDNSRLEARGVAIAGDSSIWITTPSDGLWEFTKDQEFLQYTSDNSFLPVNELRNILIDNQVFYISTDGLGMIRHDFQTEETIYYTDNNSRDLLESNFNINFKMSPSGTLWIKNGSFLTRLSEDLEWESFRVGIYNDIFVVSDNEIYIAADERALLFNGENMTEIIGDFFENYGAILKDSKGNLWISEFRSDGIYVGKEGEFTLFSNEENPDIPSQVFKFIEHQDTVYAVGTIGNNVLKLSLDESTNVLNEFIESSIELFPNPANQYTTIQSFDLDVEFWEIYDLVGKKVKESQSAGESIIDLASFESGQFVVIIHTQFGSTRKMISVFE